MTDLTRTPSSISSITTSSPTLPVEQDPAVSPTTQASHLPTSQTAFDALYREWYDNYQRSPLLAGPPPAPFNRHVAASPHPLPTLPHLPPRAHTLAPAKDIYESLTAKPEVYDGDKDKFVEWWRTIKLYLAGFGENELTDRQKIIIVLSYMRGNNAAGIFADFYVFQGLLSSPSTFDEFSAQIHQSFRPAALQRAAHNKLLSLRQDCQETVEDFIGRMKHLVIEADYDVVTHASLLIYILRNGVQNKVVEQVERFQPDLFECRSFTRWESALIEADQVLTEMAERKRGIISSVYRDFPNRPITSNNFDTFCSYEG